jgi:hypothetical protein
MTGKLEFIKACVSFSSIEQNGLVERSSRTVSN